jgi:hypothetical protein
MERLLSNLEWTESDYVGKVFVLPFCTNFQSHDSFIIVTASELLEPCRGLQPTDKCIAENWLVGLHVLVGFQMTISGSGKYKDEPS